MLTRRGRTGLVAAVLLAAVSTACGGGSTPAPAPSASAATSTPTPTLTPSSRVSPAGRPVHCVDPVGDALGDDADLTGVDVDIRPDAVAVTWRMTVDIDVLTRLPQPLLLAVDLEQAGPGVDQPRVSFLAKATDGVFRTPFVSVVPGEYVDAVGPPVVDGTAVTATFPPTVLDGLGPSWTIRADVDLAILIDECRV